jgi:ADP-heptose:LPS heptosyltransferase
MTWPAVRAFKRLNQDSEITYLTRARFQAALTGLKEVSHVEILPTQEVVEPLFSPTIDVKESFDRMSNFVDRLKAHSYDRVYNLSFSPFSSYMTHALTAENTRVFGYTRFADGYLAIPDDISAYFYAQVGVQRSNRYHLAEIFATQMGVDLIPQDWRVPENLPEVSETPSILFHLGASENHKVLPSEKWIAIINQLIKQIPDSVGLIGSAAESGLADKILSSTPTGKVTNLIGKTTLPELFSHIAQADIVVGCDSAPMHMASLVGTPCLNISLPTVNFWETGPRAQGSYVFRIQKNEDVPSDMVAQIIVRMRSGDKQDLSVYPVVSGTPSYRALASREAEFQWNLIQAIYTGTDFPQTDKPEIFDGFSKLQDINAFLLEQLSAFSVSKDASKHGPFIDRGEEIIDTIAKLVPSLAILIRWYQAEKARLGPEDQETLIAKTIKIHEMLDKVCRLYTEAGITIGRENTP